MTTTPGKIDRWLVLAALTLLASVGVGFTLEAQVNQDVPALRAQLERRFDVLPLQEGVLLRPRVRGIDARSIEIHQGAVAIDGHVVTGAELRTRLGSDADLVLRASYLSSADQAVLSGAVAPPPAAGAPVAPGAPGAPTPPSAPLPPRPESGVGAGSEATSPSAGPSADERPGRGRERRGPFGRRGGGDRVRFGGTVVVEADETVEGDVVVIGGRARILGRVNGEVVVIGGGVELGPEADVARDVVVVGGTLNRDPAARIGGEVQEVGVGPINIDPRVSWPPFDFGRIWGGGNPFGAVSSLVATGVRLGVMCLLSVFVLLLGGGYVDGIRALAAAEPLKVGAVGFFSQALMVPVAIVLVIVLIITIIGIPLLLLLPFLFMALALLALVGFTAVARHLGARVAGAFGVGDASPYVLTVAGVVAIVAPLLLARLIGLAGGPLWMVSAPLAVVGFLTEYLAWTVGFGAALFWVLGGRPPVTPPPLPQS